MDSFFTEEKVEQQGLMRLNYFGSGGVAKGAVDAVMEYADLVQKRLLLDGREAAVSGFSTSDELGFGWLGDLHPNSDSSLEAVKREIGDSLPAVDLVVFDTHRYVRKRSYFDC